MDNTTAVEIASERGCHGLVVLYLLCFTNPRQSKIKQERIEKNSEMDKMLDDLFRMIDFTLPTLEV
jgi:hypothetical protein